MSWTGGCLCGAVRYEINGPPAGANYCHCRMCQRLSGSVVTAWATFDKSAIRFTGQNPKVYKSSQIAERVFCASCGSQLLCRPLGRDEIDVAMGSLDNPQSLTPEAHWGVESQMPWLTIKDELPRKRTEEWLSGLEFDRRP